MWDACSTVVLPPHHWLVQPGCPWQSATSHLPGWAALQHLCFLPVAVHSAIVAGSTQVLTMLPVSLQIPGPVCAGQLTTKALLKEKPPWLSVKAVLKGAVAESTTASWPWECATQLPKREPVPVGRELRASSCSASGGLLLCWSWAHTFLGSSSQGLWAADTPRTPGQQQPGTVRSRARGPDHVCPARDSRMGGLCSRAPNWDGQHLLGHYTALRLFLLNSLSFPMSFLGAQNSIASQGSPCLLLLLLPLPPWSSHPVNPWHCPLRLGICFLEGLSLWEYLC